MNEDQAIETHHEMGKRTRESLKTLGLDDPENLPPAPSLRPELARRWAGKKKAKPLETSEGKQESMFNSPPDEG